MHTAARRPRARRADLRHVRGVGSEPVAERQLADTPGALFDRLGQPAPREAFTRLFINGEYQGVYALVEAVDPVFLSRAFGDPGGYAFEYHWLNEFHAEYLGRSLGRYKELFEPASHESDSDTTLYLPLHDLFREINAAPSPAWRAGTIAPCRSGWSGTASR